MSAVSPILSIRNLTVGFPRNDGPEALAVNGLDLTLQTGQIMGVVGESGCGKSLTSLAILGLIPPPGQRLSGSIQFEGQELTTLDGESLRRIRGKRIALIPQDPLTALNPVYTVGNQLMEVTQTHLGHSRDEARRHAIALLDRVQIPDAKNRINQYPHEFSGGMRQRVMIAMALSCSPSLLIADEPTTALDVTVQAQILGLIRELQRDMGMSILLITHDLGVVAELCDHVSVMYAGRVVESAQCETLFDAPSHPYTQGLFASRPKPGQTILTPIEGQPPAIDDLPPGCSFAPRCAKVTEICHTAFPVAVPLGPEHWAHCVAL